jgi:hypothetical protein
MLSSSRSFVAEQGGTRRGRGPARLRLGAATLVLGISMLLPATANEPAPPHVARHIAEARLTGSGRLTWWGFHVYDAALYAQGPLDVRDPTAQPFALELRYARRLKGEAIAEASRDEMARLGLGSDEQRAAWFDRMARLFPDVAAGQRLAGVNLPGRGVRFYFDGRFIGAIEEPAFARAFFAIWLDERTQAPGLRESLTPPERTAPRT